MTNLKETFSDGCVKLETEDRIIKMESLTSYIVLDEKMVVESSTKVVRRDVIGEIPHRESVEKFIKSPRVLRLKGKPSERSRTVFPALNGVS